MKKSLIISAALLFFIALAPHAFAQSVPPGGACTQDSDCQDANGQSYGCYPEGGGICTVDGDAAADGTVQPGGACTNDNSCADGSNGQSYGCYEGVCTPDGDAPICTVNAGCTNYGSGWTCQVPAGQTSGTCVAPAGSTNATAGTTNASTGFFPLAPIPGLDDNQSSTSASSLASFLQNLYKYLIGVAAILAVIQIIRGGLEYATQDSVSKKGEGRKHIEQALLGLVLVLAPALVFTIINPSILNLSVDLPPLNTPNGSTSVAPNGATTVAGGTGTPPANGCNTATGNSEFQSVTCSTSAAAQSWSSAQCGGQAVIPTSCTGGYENGNCLSGYQAICLGVSSSQTFVEIGQTGSLLSTINTELRPTTASQSAVASFVSGCSTGNVCVLTGNIGTEGSCQAGSFSFNTASQNPSCDAAEIICTTNNTSCASGYVLCDAASANCPDYH